MGSMALCQRLVERLQPSAQNPHALHPAPQVTKEEYQSERGQRGSGLSAAAAAHAHGLWPSRQCPNP